MEDILDLDTFPLDRPDSAEYAALVARCKAELATEGMFSLSELMRPDVAQQTADETADDMATRSFHHSREHNVYFVKDIPEVAPDHPALTRFQTSNHTLCGDQVTDTAVTKVYEYEPLRTFIAEVMEKPVLYLMDDPLARINVMSYGAEDQLNWHFDRSEFTVTLLLQAPSSGGAFEYRTDLRSTGDQNYEGVARLLTGQDPDVKTMSLKAGSLNVFRGVNTPHRVTPVEGDRRRVIAVLSYYENAGVQFSDSEKLGFFGRTA